MEKKKHARTRACTHTRTHTHTHTLVYSHHMMLPKYQNILPYWLTYFRSSKY